MSAQEYYNGNIPLGTQQPASRRRSRRRRDGESRRRDDDDNDEYQEQSQDGHYSEHRHIEDWARRSEMHKQTPEIHLDGVPYPTIGSGALVPMPPDAPYPIQRSHSDQPPRYSREVALRDDRWDQSSRSLTRSRSEYDVSRDRSFDHSERDRGWHHDDDDDGGSHRGYLNKRDHDGKKFNHVTAGLAGALAGGYVGKKVSRGDTIATLAGALVGAVGAGLAEREIERRERKRDERHHHHNHHRY